MECNIDSVLIVLDDDPISRRTQTKVRIVCLPLNEELPFKNGTGWRKPWVAGESGARHKSRDRPQAVSSGGTSASWEISLVSESHL